MFRRCCTIFNSFRVSALAYAAPVLFTDGEPGEAHVTSCIVPTRRITVRTSTGDIETVLKPGDLVSVIPLASCGACAALANALSDSPTRIGLGFVR